MRKVEVKELYDRLEAFHSDENMTEKIGGSENENDKTITDALSIINEVLQNMK